MVHHSDKCRPDRLVGVMITDFQQDFGETDFHYIDIGHIHHKMVVKEHPNVTLESWNQLAPADKWAHDNGYRSRSSMTTVLRSRTYGEIGRHTLPVEQVRDAISRAEGGAYVPSRRLAFAA
jgi:DNA repair exonuclease SbcCD nuclease subunit